MTLKHTKQIAAFNDPARFKFILAGRRGGKTFLMAEDIVKTIHSAPRNGAICYLGPSNQHAKELIWTPLLERFHQLGWDVTARVSKSRIELSKGRKIYVLGAERISRVRGHRFIKAYLDELAYFTEDISEIWRALRPTLADYKGGAIAATTPNGKGTPAYDFYNSIKEQDTWSYHHWITADNPFMCKMEIFAAKQELDEKSYRQEYEAGWESFEGLAYYSFDENAHVIKQPPIDFSIPIHIAFDFNVDPSTLLVSQFEHGKMRYKKEYSYKNSSTEITVENFCMDFKDQAKIIDLRIRGDAAGSARKSNTGKSDYYYVKDILGKWGFKFKHEVMSSNPAIIDRLKTVNSWLKPYQEERKIEIDPICKDLIRDLSSQEMVGRIPSDKNNLGHKADALGYDIYWQQIAATRKPQGVLQL